MTDTMMVGDNITDELYINDKIPGQNKQNSIYVATELVYSLSNKHVHRMT